jgi:hypothetical protein
LLWGTNDLKHKVTVELAGKKYRAKVKGGAWNWEVKSLTPGGPYELRVVEQYKKRENRLVLTNVVVGEVWVLGVDTVWVLQTNVAAPALAVQTNKGEPPQWPANVAVPAGVPLQTNRVSHAGAPPWWPAGVPPSALVKATASQPSVAPEPLPARCRFQIGPGLPRPSGGSAWEVHTPESAARSALSATATCLAGVLAAEAKRPYLGLIQVPAGLLRTLERPGTGRLSSAQDPEGKDLNAASDVAYHYAGRIQAEWGFWYARELEARKIKGQPADDIFEWQEPVSLVRVLRPPEGSALPVPFEALPRARGAIW